MSTIDLRSRARWLQVPDGSDDGAVQEFAMAYDGYRLHGPNPDELTHALRDIIDPLVDVLNRLRSWHERTLR